MKKYIIKRLAQSIPVLLGISIIVFALVKLAPGDPVKAMYAGVPTITEDQIAHARAVLGLDQPIPVQYFKWIGRVLKGDLGNSIKHLMPVSFLIKQRMWSTFYLSLVSLILSLIVALPIGVISSTKQYSKFDYGFTIFAFIGISIPSFFFATLLINVFAANLQWLPVSGMQTAGNYFKFPHNVIDIGKHTIMPAIVLGLGNVASFMRYSRSSMLEVIRQDYIRTARAKGLKERVVIYKHALRNAMIPIVTLLGFSIPALFSGALIVEEIFSWPGMGRLGYVATMDRDYNVMMGVNLFLASLTLVGNLTADIAYAFVDPRIRY